MVIWWVFIRFDIDTVDIPCAEYRMDGQTIHFEAYKSSVMHILCVRAEDTGVTLPLRAGLLRFIEGEPDKVFLF